MTPFEVLSGRLTLDTSDWQRSLRQAQPALAQFVANMGRAMDALKGGITSVATALGGMTPVLTGLTAAGVKLGASFEQALGKVSGATQAAAGASSTVAQEVAQKVEQETISWRPRAAASDVRASMADAVAAAGGEAVIRTSRRGPLPTSQFRAPSSEAMTALAAYGEAVLAQFERSAELQGKDREMSLKNARDLQLAFQAMAGALELGDKGLADFQAGAEKAGEIAKQLGIDLAGLDAIQKKNAFHAAGKMTPDEQSAQLAQPMWMKGALGQVARHVQDAATAVFAQIAQGPGQLNQLIADAKAKGDPLGALDLIIQNVQMKAGMASVNLHNLAQSSILGNIGGFPGVDNSAYLMSIGDPAAKALTGFQELLANLRQQRADLVRQLAHPKHHMAEGGIVNLPTVAQIGESGPEAVVPLNRLWQELRQGFGGTISQFQNNFAFWTQRIGQQMNLGNLGGLGVLDRFAQRQDAIVHSLTAFQQHRQIDLQPLAGSHVRRATNRDGSPLRHQGAASSGASPYVGPTITVNVHGADLTTPAGARQVAQLLVPHIDAVASRMGTDMTGRSALRSSPQVGPLFNGHPTAYPR